MNGRLIARLTSRLVLGMSLTMVLPALVALLDREWGSLRSFGLSMLLGSLVGFLLAWLGRGTGSSIFRREALVVVGLSWFLVPALGAIPYLLDGVFTSPADAWFESVSGFTTTGATVLTEIETSLTRSMHVWRMQTHWLGGMGIMVLFVAVLPSLGVGGKMLFRNEVSGPITESLQPRVRETSAALWKIYIAMTVVLTMLLLWPGKMHWEDAIAHAMTTMGTGGFSNKNDSLAGFESPVVEWIVLVFMILAGVNFSLYFLALQKRRVGAVLKDFEFRAYVGLIVVASVVVSVSILPRHGDVGDAIRYGAFQVASIVTTTGLMTDDFDQYPPLARNIMFFLMFTGGCAGSTAGGLKIFRFIVLVKAAWMHTRRTFRPQSVLPVKINDHALADSTVNGVLVTFFAYLALLVFGTLVMSTMLPDLESALSATIACLGNVGPGLGPVGPTQNFGFLPAFGKVLLSVLMIFGRLEVFTLLVLFAPSFWKR